MKIGVVVMLEGSGPADTPRYRAVRELALRAEEGGLDSLWLYDHLLFRGEGPPMGQWECFTFLAALAEATSRIELGTLVACAAFRNPVLTAKIATALDEISDGRFTLGIGAGWNEAEFRALGLPFDHRVSRLAEALQIIAPLLREGRVDFRGEYLQAPDCHNLPRGPRADGPPILIPGFGPRMARLAARYADAINTAVDADSPAKAWDELRAACAEVGRDPATLAVTMPFWAAFPDLGPIPPHMQGSTYGSAEALAERWRAHAAAGLAHLMVDFRPNTPAGLGRVLAALRLLRAGPANQPGD